MTVSWYFVVRRPVVTPVEVGVDDDGEHGLAEVVVRVALLGVLEVVREEWPGRWWTCPSIALAYGSRRELLGSHR